ncbi:MAG: glycosyltransferase family 4 protein [Casimicrobiaceae bacterium]
MKPPRLLLSTIAARSGGVPAMVGFAVDVLQHRFEIEVIIAYYEPYSQTPALSVPTFALGRRRPGAMCAEPMFGCETWAIGAWLPELEFSTYALTPDWRRLIDGCSAHLVVSGNVLAARPLVAAGKPAVVWIATPWEADRSDRVRAFPLVRRLVDRSIVTPVMRRLELRLLRAVSTLALSDYTAHFVEQATGRRPPVLPVPVDTERFAPGEKVAPPRIVFAGRLDDPRKNVALLLEALRRLRQRGLRFQATLAGAADPATFAAQTRALELDTVVDVLPYQGKDALAALLRSASVFALPSHQEGLCIAALEAMACGLPVVSTRCGGPEEFVLPDVTGELCAFDADELANAMARLLGDRSSRERMGAAARALIESRYSRVHAEQVLVDALRHQFPDLPLR